jgi:hypothetical protein
MIARIRAAAIATLCLFGGSSMAAGAPAAERAEAVTAAAEKSAEQTIHDLEARIEALERQNGTSAPVDITEPAPAEDTGEAPSPAEEREIELGLRPAKPARIADRNNFDDRQDAAARPGGYMFDPDYRGFIPVPLTILAIYLNCVVLV